MTTPEDVKPDNAPPTAVPKKPAAKKPAAVKVAQKTGAQTKPTAKKASIPATDAAVSAPVPKKPAAPKTAAKLKVEVSPGTAGIPRSRARTKPVSAASADIRSAAPTPSSAPEVVTPPIPTAPKMAVSEPTAQPIDIKEKPVNWANVHAAKIIQRAAAKSGKKDHFPAYLRLKTANYWRLARMDRPIGTLLLLWPTLWSLWIAAKGVPSIKNLVIFILGVIVMRAAGCVINDFADRKIDGKVLRTKNRPLATGAVSSREAIGLFIALCLIAFTLVLFTDPLTIKLSVGGLILAFCYPFMKRHTHLPQVVLGAAFAWGIPMAYAAEAGELNQSMWLIYLAVVLWTVAYDTFYAMVDRDDDVKIGVKSTAILFGEQDRVITGILQFLTLYTLFLVGKRFELGPAFYLGLAVAAGLFAYQQWLIRFRVREACFKAFINNNWVGVAIFAGIATDYAVR